MVDYQEVVSCPTERLEQTHTDPGAVCPLVIELADGTVLKFDYIGSWFWNAWYYLAGRCTRVTLFGRDIQVSDVHQYNLRLPRRSGPIGGQHESLDHGSLIEIPRLRGAGS